MIHAAACRLALARKDVVWNVAWQQLPAEAQSNLDRAGLGVPWTWADLVLGGETDPRGYLVRVVDEIVEPLETDDGWADLGDLLVLLVAAAQDAAQGHSARAAAVSNLKVSLRRGSASAACATSRATRCRSN